MKTLGFLKNMVFILALLAPSAPVRNQLTLIYYSPMPFTRNVSVYTSIAVRQGEPLDERCADDRLFTVTGSQSGRHPGRARLSDDRLTLLFYPDQPFKFGEKVTVTINPGLITASDQPIQGEEFHFFTMQEQDHAPVSPPGKEDLFREPSAPDTIDIGHPFITHPEFTDIISIAVTTPAQNVADGLIFMATMNGVTYDSALLLLDNTGEPVFIQQFPYGVIATDLKKERVNGVPYLVFFAGQSQGGFGYGSYFVLDQHYELVNSWNLGNGYRSDLHDIQLLANGHALLLAYTPIPVDLSPYGGPVDGIVLDIILQEQDSNRNVIFEWHGSDHLPLTDTKVGFDTPVVDFMHTNAIEEDLDGNLLISSRHMDEVTKIDRLTGDVLWRLGGKANQFTFTNDGGFFWQHDVRRQADGHITLFDNGPGLTRMYSRAVEYEIDEVGKTITNTWEYDHGQDILGLAMGNVQRLPDGNTLIGWGTGPTVTEVNSQGVKQFELELGNLDFYTGGLAYRAYRFPWEAIPNLPPRLAGSFTTPTTAELFFSWNGATQIDGYEIFMGKSTDSMTYQTTVARTGFETETTLTGLDFDDCFFTVRPIHQMGILTPFSNILLNPGCTNFYYFPLVNR